MITFTRRAGLKSLAVAPLAGTLASRSVAAQSPVPELTAAGQVIVLSNSSPQVTMIDPVSNTVVASNAFPDFPGWTWNDDLNYSDDKLLWLGSRHPDTQESWVRSLDMDTLQLVDEIPTGPEPMTLYLSRGGQNGLFYVGKMGGFQVLAIDPATATVAQTWDVPVGKEGVVCDIDVYTDAEGVERVYYPTWQGDSVVTVSPETGEPETVNEDFPDGGGPWMGTAGPDGNFWVQWEANTNDVLDGADLSLVKRIPVGNQPTNVTFSPDGQYAYISYFGDSIITVVDVETLEKITDITVGSVASHVAVNPDGATIYAIVTQEATVAVIDTDSWEVAERINIGTNPGSIYFRAGG
jgi:DNA-binding beta-propeller fold protein YncE